MNDSIDRQEVGDPVEAFRNLTAQIAVLRQAVESFPKAIKENRPPDVACRAAAAKSFRQEG